MHPIMNLSTQITIAAVCSLTGLLAGLHMSFESEAAFEDTQQSTRPALGPRAGGEPRAGGIRLLSGSTMERTSARYIESIYFHPDPATRTRQWLDYIRSLSQSEKEQVLDEVIRLGMEDSTKLHADRDMFHMLLVEVARKDPAAELARYSEKHGPNRDIWKEILTFWAATDPKAALNWAGDDPSLLPAIIKGIAQTDPDRATELLRGIDGTRERERALNVLASHQIKRSEETAKNWASTLDDTTLRRKAVNRVAEKLSRKDPQGTAQWLMTNPGGSASSAMRVVMARVARTNPETAIAYLSAIDDESLRRYALRGVAQEKAKLSVDEATALIESYPGTVTDEFLDRTAGGADGGNTAFAIRVTQLIKDPALRRKMLHQRTHNWITRDHEAALAWIERNDLPEEILKELESHIQAHRP